ncbi:MAG TPA: tol-pal system protein YbgF [Geobacteraceae bacterium]|nr:tol-pal system protein YbgF [Geobacteraceae bacterium]
MHAKTLFPVLVFLLVIAGCASRDDVSNLQRDMEEVKNRIYQMEKDIGSIRVEAKEGTDSKIKSYREEIENLRKTVADIQASQDTMRVDIQSVSGKVDDVKQLAKKPSDELALLKEDTDRRLLALEGKAAGQDKAAADAPPKDATAESLYQEGIAAYKNGDMKKAREIFSKFIAQYPKNELAANAHYWIGETYYNEKNLEQAILEYQEVIKNFPGKEKAPAAMLKQGMSFKGLGDAKSAKYVFKKLTETYPKSDEAAKAKKLLKGLK